MKSIAIITGASSGIGADLAREHAKNGGDLVLVARRIDLLEQLKDELQNRYGIAVHTIGKDLSRAEAPYELYQETKHLNPSYLINNAGFGLGGEFQANPVDQIESMMHVNMRALTLLTRLFLQEMVARNTGRIMNVASTASFMPGPLQAVYFATKAYVRSLSWALTEELRNTNVTVTTLCPGPTQTEFESRSNLTGSALFKNAKPSALVAKTGYQAMLKGRRNVVTHRGQHILIKLLPFIPTKAALSITRKLQEV